MVSLQQASEGVTTVANKEGRLEELRRFNEAITTRRNITVQEARQFRGMFVYARGQALARCGAPAPVALGSIADGRSQQRHDMRRAVRGAVRIAAESLARTHGSACPRVRRRGV